MSGILDSKTRIMDVVLTVEGRRQLAAGKFVPEFASFTDRHVFYAKDAASGSDDASAYIYFEAGNRVQDQIVIENDDSGLLVAYDGGDTQVSTDGKIFSSSIETIQSPSGQGTYNRINYDPITGSFASMFEKVSGSILLSLKEQQLISTDYPYELYKTFEATPLSVNFTYNNLSPFRAIPPVAEKASLDPLFTSLRMSHLDNFQFLPPVYKSDTSELLPVGDFIPLKSTGSLTYDQLISYLQGPDPQIPAKQKVEVEFAKTSIQNNLFMQLFEGKKIESSADVTLQKLDYIDFGEFKDESDRDNPYRRVFFVGKVYINAYGSPSFVNLFTIVAE
jgi:hypothetical protein